jgi:hypothetical protein
MQVTLKKANSFQNELKRLLGDIELKHQVSINEFTTDYKSVIESNRLLLLTQINNKLALTTALYYLRELVGEANLKSGIHSLLTEQSYNESVLAFYNTIKINDVVKEDVEIESRLDKIRKSDGTRYSYDTEFSTSLLTRDDIIDIISKKTVIKKRLIKIKDELDKLNSSTIEISDEYVSILEKANLI